LLSRYRGLIQLRDKSPALRGGTLRLLSPPGGHSPFLAYLRQSPEQQLLVVHNLSSKPERFAIYLTGYSFERLFADGGVGDPTGRGPYQVSLAAHSSGVWLAKATKQ